MVFGEGISKISLSDLLVLIYKIPMTPPKILHRPQEDQAQKKGAEKPELLVIDSRATLHDLLRQIQQNVTYFLEHKDPKIRSTIYAILDKVAEVFRSSGD